jgi:3-oxoadipate enol-lactonase
VREVKGPPGAPTVILLHGLSATADLNWFPTFAPLGRHFHVVALDHRGHGRGIRSRRLFRLADCADDVVALADVLGVDRFIAAGYSMGGPIAQLVWRRHPERVAGLVLCATSRNFAGHPAERLFFASTPGIVFALRLTPRPFLRQVGRRIFDLDQSDPMQQWAMEELRRSSPQAMLEAVAAIGRFSSHQWVREIDVPTAVLVTTEDRLVAPRRQRKLADAIPDAVEYEVHGDHAVCVVGYRRFVPVLIEACQDVARRAGLGAAATRS